MDTKVLISDDEGVPGVDSGYSDGLSPLLSAQREVCLARLELLGMELGVVVYYDHYNRLTEQADEKA